jgi:hypothetical protein
MRKMAYPSLGYRPRGNYQQEYYQVMINLPVFSFSATFCCNDNRICYIPVIIHNMVKANYVIVTT